MYSTVDVEKENKIFILFERRGKREEGGVWRWG